MAEKIERIFPKLEKIENAGLRDLRSNLEILISRLEPEKKDKLHGDIAELQNEARTMKLIKDDGTIRFGKGKAYEIFLNERLPQLYEEYRRYYVK